MLQERVNQWVVVEVIITEIEMIIAAGWTDLLWFTTLEKCYAHFWALKPENMNRNKKKTKA